MAAAILTATAVEVAHAQDKPQEKKEEPKLGWSNTSDLSLVVTSGNSASSTLGFSNELRYRWTNARFGFDVSGVRARTSDDRYFLVDAGLEFPVGGALPPATLTLVEPPPTLDVANYTIASEYERNISARFFWNAGGSWYRNDDAGILNRYITYAGLGHTWVDTERRRFSTTYGVSYTDRQEEEPDPEKDRRFGGVRFGWDYAEHFRPGATFDSDFALNLNLSDASDYSVDTVNALSVSITNRIALKVSLQWLFENEPALETDLDVIARVELLNPDGIPGTGDERYRTVSSGGTSIVVGSSDARRARLDTIFRTALVIKF